MRSHAVVRSLPGPQFVTQAALDYRTLFHGDRDRFVYLALVRRAAQRFSWRIYGYSLLTERTHLVLSAPNPAELHGGVRWMRRSFSSYLREDRGDRRWPWRSGYGLQELEDPMLWPVLACIELEPVRTGLALEAGTYLWSSAAAHIASVRPYVPLDDEAWKAEFGPIYWRDYLGQVRGDLEYWRALRWAVAPDFTLPGKNQKAYAAAAGRSGPAGAQPHLGFGA